MFCPQCGTETLEQLKFCKKCGTNLRRIQGVMSKGGAGPTLPSDRIDWEREALDEHREKRKRSPEEKRYDEIKAGVITSSVGLGVMIFLFSLFHGLAHSTSDPGVQNIFFAIPFVGIIPFLIGLGIVFNGLFISKRIVELKRRQEQWTGQPSHFPVANTSPVPLLSENTEQSIPDFSVAEPTTKTLRDPVPVSSSRDND